VDTRRRLKGRPLTQAGLALVAVAMVGLAALAAAELPNGTAVVVRHDLSAGTVIADADLRAVPLRWPRRSAEHYVSRTRDAVGHRLIHRLSGGELLPRAALVVDAESLTEVPVSVRVHDVADGIRAGTVVDVWVVGQGAARLALGSGRVTSLGAVSGDRRQLLISVGVDDLARLADVLVALDGGRLVVMRRAQ